VASRNRVFLNNGSAEGREIIDLDTKSTDMPINVSGKENTRAEIMGFRHH